MTIPACAAIGAEATILWAPAHTSTSAMSVEPYSRAYMDAAYDAWVLWSAQVLWVTVNDMWAFAGMYNMGDMIYDNLPRSEG